MKKKKMNWKLVPCLKVTRENCAMLVVILLSAVAMFSNFQYNISVDVQI